MSEVCAHRGQCRSPHLHRECKAGKCAFHVAFNFRLASIPSRRSNEWMRVTLGMNHQDRAVPNPLWFAGIVAHHTIQRVWKELIPQVFSVKNHAGYRPVTGFRVGYQEVCNGLIYMLVVTSYPVGFEVVMLPLLVAHLQFFFEVIIGGSHPGSDHFRKARCFFLKRCILQTAGLGTKYESMFRVVHVNVSRIWMRGENFIQHYVAGVVTGRKLVTYVVY